MDLRPLKHPLPFLLVFLFVATAVVDVVHRMSHAPEPLPDLLQGAPLRFDAAEPVVDLRPRAEGTIMIAPEPRFLGGSWSRNARNGAWITGRQATLELETGRGGYRTLVIECRPAEGNNSVRSLEVRVNGSSCGILELVPGWKRYRLALAEGAFLPGVNRIAFLLPARADGPAMRRRLLLRRLGMFLSPEAGTDSLRRHPLASLNFEKNEVVIRSSGRLELPVVLDGRADAVKLRCRFIGGGGRCEVEVASPQGTGPGLDPAIRSMVDLQRAGSKGVRVPVHGRRGEFLLSIDAELDRRQESLVLSSLRLVRETGPPAPPRKGDRRR